MPTRRPVNRPGPEPDRDRGQVPEVDVELATQVLDRGRELLGVAPATRELDRSHDLARVADGDGDLRGGGVDGEYEHLSAPGPQRAVRPGC